MFSSHRVFLLLTLLSASFASAEVSLLHLYGDHMVLQREQTVPIRGYGAPGEKVTVTLAAAGKPNLWSGSAETGTDGTWSVSLPAQKAGGPFEITVAGSNTLTLHDVLFGDIWLCSGQSNMEMSTSFARDPEKEIAEANYPQIRLITSPFSSRANPQKDLVAARWRVCSPESVGDFSAVGYYFGRDLFRNLKIPIGIISSSAGGTAIECWINEQGARDLPGFEGAVRDAQALPPLVNDGGWQAVDFSDADWKTMLVPGEWEKSGQGMDEFNGAVWFRREVTIPQAWAQKDLTLHFTPIDDGDVTYFNGVRVGGINLDTPNGWKTPREYPIPAALVKAGRAVIAVRITDQLGAGGFCGPADQMWIAPSATPAEKIALDGPWKYQIAETWPSQVLPLSLYNSMIAPWSQFPIAGFAWYQGESNAGDAKKYVKLLDGLITGWREVWNQKDLPFYVVQLPNYQAYQTEPVESNWAQLRESQALVAANLDHVGLVTTIDLGEVSDIHPKNKQDVGNRIARSVLAQTYGQTLPFTGPVCDEVKIENGSMRLHFTNVGAGLQAEGDLTKGFAVAGENNQFIWANATVAGDTVTLKSDQVPAPVHMRYAWADSPNVTIYNSDRFPLAPFRIEAGKVIPVAKSK